MTASAFATYRRIDPQVRPAGGFGHVAPETVLRPWRGPQPSGEHLEGVDLVSERMLDAMIRIAKDGPAADVRLLGTVETRHSGLESAAQEAARSGIVHGLEEWRGQAPSIRSFSVVSGEDEGKVRAELRSDGVIFVYTPDPARARDVAVRVVRCALGVDVAENSD